MFSGWAIRLRGAIALLRPSRRYKGAGTEESGKKGWERGETGREWKDVKKGSEGERERVGKKGGRIRLGYLFKGPPSS